MSNPAPASSGEPQKARKSKKKSASSAGHAWIDRIVATYGDLLFDFSQSLLWSPADAPDAYRSILRTLNRRRRKEEFQRYERPWILQIAFQELRGMKRRSPRTLTPAEQVMLDSNPDPKARLRFFDSYFHRLTIESQLLLLLRDKYGVPLTEIASILEIPEASARLQRLQALRLLESWIWSGVDGTGGNGWMDGPECFESQNRMSEALDGVLPPSLNQAFDEHVAGCDACRTKADRIRELLRVLNQQARATMPLELRDDPLAFPTRRLRKFAEDPKAAWKRLPVALRLLVEGVSIAAVVVLGIRLGPVVREMYEARMEKRLQTMIAAEDITSQPLARGRSDAEDAELADEVANSEGDSENSTGVEVDSDVQVGKGEIWRFNLKTDAPALVRNQILKTLEEVGISEKTPGIGGVEAPGGIQFDILVPQSAIAQLKNQLEKLAGVPSANLPFSETFTWYKNRSKKPIPNGTSRVVIWLSQI